MDQENLFEIETLEPTNNNCMVRESQQTWKEVALPLLNPLKLMIILRKQNFRLNSHNETLSTGFTETCPDYLFAQKSFHLATRNKKKFKKYLRNIFLILKQM